VSCQNGVPKQDRDTRGHQASGVSRHKTALPPMRRIFALISCRIRVKITGSGVSTGRRKMSPWTTGLCRVALAALAGSTALPISATAQIGPLVTVTPGPSPFKNCTADDVGGQAGINYPTLRSSLGSMRTPPIPGTSSPVGSRIAGPTAAHGATSPATARTGARPGPRCWCRELPFAAVEAGCLRGLRTRG
jgi:hypothetical protein